MEENLLIKFLVCGQEGRVKFRMNKASKISTLKKTYSLKVGIALENLQFTFNKNNFRWCGYTSSLAASELWTSAITDLDLVLDFSSVPALATSSSSDAYIFNVAVHFFAFIFSFSSSVFSLIPCPNLYMKYSIFWEKFVRMTSQPGIHSETKASPSVRWDCLHQPEDLLHEPADVTPVDHHVPHYSPCPGQDQAHAIAHGEGEVLVCQDGEPLHERHPCWFTSWLQEDCRW